MKTSIIKIGNSKGIILNKMLLEKYNLKEAVTIEEKEGGIFIKPERRPREGWADKFKEMHENGHDELLIPDVFEDETFDDI